MPAKHEGFNLAAITRRRDKEEAKKRRNAAARRKRERANVSRVFKSLR